MKYLKLAVRNALAWSLLQLSLSYLMMHMPVSLLKNLSLLFKIYYWERQVWQSIFKVKKWKNRLPDSSDIFSASYNHRQLVSSDIKILQQFEIETTRAELTHTLSFLLFPLFYLWNPKWAARLNIIYAVVSNFPFIIVQRYNRPKIQHLIVKKKGRQYDSTRTKKR